MKKSMRRLSYFGAIILLVAVIMSISACSGYGTTPASTTPPASSQPSAASGNAVTLQGFAFSPASLTIKVGDTVTWTNKDGTTHTVTSDSGVFNSGDLATNATFSYTFKTAGTFPYYCAIHPTMKGTIIVR